MASSLRMRNFQSSSPLALFQDSDNNDTHIAESWLLMLTTWIPHASFSPFLTSKNKQYFLVPKQVWIILKDSPAQLIPQPPWS